MLPWQRRRQQKEKDRHEEKMHSDDLTHEMEMLEVMKGMNVTGAQQGAAIANAQKSAAWAQATGNMVTGAESAVGGIFGGILGKKPSTEQNPVPHSTTNYTPYLIGGGVIILGLLFFTGKKRK